MRSSAAQNGSLLLLVTNHFTTATSLIGFWEQRRLSTISMDGWSSQGCLTSGHLRDAIVTTPNAWRLSGVISAIAIGHVKHWLR
eukprot:6762982-Pyramimonas_sp.AAC.1